MCVVSSFFLLASLAEDKGVPIAELRGDGHGERRLILRPVLADLSSSELLRDLASRRWSAAVLVTLPGRIGILRSLGVKRCESATFRVVLYPVMYGITPSSFAEEIGVLIAKPRRDGFGERRLILRPVLADLSSSELLRDLASRRWSAAVLVTLPGRIGILPAISRCKTV